MEYSRQFHHASKHHPAGRREPSDELERAHDQVTVWHKTYPAFPMIGLPRIEISESLGSAIKRRRSYIPKKSRALTLDEVGGLFEYGCGVTEGGEGKRTHHRAQPSGGGRFGVEAYLINIIPGALPAGLFHYAPLTHSLEVLHEMEFTDELFDQLFTYPWARHASAVCVLTGVFDRVQNKYGERGYRYLLLEAGHIAQNFHLIGSARGIGMRMFGGTNDEAVERLLDLDGVNESVLYAMVISGK